MSAIILTVDDSRTARAEIRQTLEADGHRVLEAADGKRALEVLSAVPPVDLIITDLYMPEIDGFSLVRKIRRLEHYRSIPVVMLTIESEAEMRRRGSVAGVSEWLVKPGRPEDFCRTVRRLLDRENVRWAANGRKKVNFQPG